MTERSDTARRYAGLARALAGRALGMAADVSPHRAAAGEARWSMARAVPAARVVLGEARPGDADTLLPATEALTRVLDHPSGKVTDGFGHHRPAYVLLSLHLLGFAATSLDHRAARAAVNAAAAAYTRARTHANRDPRLACWSKLLAIELGHEGEDGAYGLAAMFATPSDAPAPLVPHHPDDLIDAWTYRELVGLHALFLLGRVTGDAEVARRARASGLFHVEHTQPDYTTYQPWALAAFASTPATAVFAEQQLHDVQTHLALEGAGGALLPGLLLADAAAALDGTMVGARGRDCFQG